MAEAILSMTQETLRNLLFEEAKFLYGVKDKIEEIQIQLEIMKSYLKDADKRQHTDESIRTWVKQLRRLAYRTEDVLETYAVEVASDDQGAEWGIENVLKRFGFIFCECFALHNVGKEIEKIMSDIKDLKEDRVKYDIHVLDGGESSREANEKLTYSIDDEEHFFGMKDDIHTLVSLITDNHIDHRVISILGMGGQGKTTLAKKIFNHRVVQSSFKAFAWVCVTQQSHTYKVLQDIHKQLVGVYMQGDQPALVRDLQNVFREKKCLVVLDDIWQQGDWEDLRCAFPMTNTSSKVLLTTRIRDVAKTGSIHEISTLTEEESWELLWAKALNRPKGQDLRAAQEFKPIGKEILRRCGYLPLAICTIGGMLREKTSPQDWNSVNENIFIYLRRGEYGGNLKNPIRSVLALSYNELPNYLKPCFLYMGNFPEDQKIEAEKLYQLWIAEGLVLKEDCGANESMMDAAERYLGCLVSRCMVEVEIDDMSTISRIESCRLHDMMRELCLAEGKEEEFLDVIDVRAQDFPNMDLSSLFHNERRLGMHIYDEDTTREGVFMRVSQQLKAQVFRTLSVRCMDYRRHCLGDISGLKEFKLLRVLRLEYCEFELPEEISELMRLKYLSLEGSWMSRLPSSISNLSYLQTLDLRVNCIIHLPDIFWKMKRLKHIYLPSLCDWRLSGNLRFNSELETLSNFGSYDGLPPCLSELVNLRYFSGKLLDENALSQFIGTIFRWRKIKWVKLEVQNIEFKSEEGSSLLRKVFLCQNLIKLQILESPIHQFPPYEPQFWPNLTRLYLYRTETKNDPMQFLAQLPKLKDLKLQWNAFMGKEMVCDVTAFPQLRSLYLYGLPNLETWRVDEGAMPNLSSLDIGACPKMKTITKGLNFSTIKRFEIWRMPEEFKETYRKLHEQARRSMVNLG